MSTTIRRAALLSCLAILVAVTVFAVVRQPGTSAWLTRTAPAEPDATASDTAHPPAPSGAVFGFPFHPNTVTAESLGTSGWFSWAYIERATGMIVGSPNQSQTNNTHSMIKAWIAADYLRLVAEGGAKPSDSALNQLRIMIIDSDNEIADQFFWGSLDAEVSINRMIATCGLTDSQGTNNDWAETQVSARDTARLGMCIADGRAAGKRWTPWLLDQMRQVRGDGDFGIRDAFAPGVRETIAIKNGWWYEDGIFRVNCLAIGDTWVLAVLQRYPAWNMDHTAGVCAGVAQQLIAIP